MDGWGAPSANQVYADVDGNVGWIGAGHVPQRPNWDGLMPVPGDGPSEWKGFLDKSEPPRPYTPEPVRDASANQTNHPDGLAHRTTFDSADGATTPHDIAGMEGKKR